MLRCDGHNKRGCEEQSEGRGQLLRCHRIKKELYMGYLKEFQAYCPLFEKCVKKKIINHVEFGNFMLLSNP